MKEENKMSRTIYTILTGSKKSAKRFKTVVVYDRQLAEKTLAQILEQDDSLAGEIMEEGI